MRHKSLSQQSLRFAVAIMFLTMLCSTRALTIVWTNTAGGNWNVTNNWNPNQVPGAADTAVITNNGTYTVTLNVSASITSLTLGGASGTQSLLVTNSSILTLASPSAVGANGTLNFSSGTIGGAGALTVNGPFNWMGGTINNTGGVTLNGTSSLTGSAGQMSLSGGGLIINAGSLTWSGSGLNFTFGVATLTNLSAGTITIASDASTQNGGGVNTIGNAGLLRKTGGTGTTAFGNVALVNTGDVQVQSGTLNLGDGGSATGTFEVSANSTLQFGGSTYTLSSAASVTGAGSAVFSGGTVNAGGAYNLAGTNTFSGATVNFTNNYTITNESVVISGGAVNFNTGGTLNFASLSLSAGTLGGNLAVPVNGPFNWSAGTINNTAGVTLNGTSSLTGSAGQMSLSSGGLLINAGSLTWSGSGLNFTFGVATLTNLSSGTIIIASDVSTQNGGGVNTIGNAGLLRKTGGTGTTAFGVVSLVNTGDVQVQSGTLNLGNGGSATGTFEVSANATLQFSGSTYTLSSAASITGAGSAVFSGGTVNAGGAYNLTGTNNFTGATVNFTNNFTITNQSILISAGAANFNTGGTLNLNSLSLSGGSLGGNLAVPVNGPFNWTAGTINNTGGVTLNGTSSLTGSVGQMSLSSGGLLINAGSLTWSGSGLNFTFGVATLTNLPTGTITISSDVSTQNGGGVNRIGNAGLLRKTGGTGTTTFGNVAFVNTGDVQVQSGTLNLGIGGSATGTFEVSANATLQFSGGTYTLSSASSITGAGLVLLSGGTVNDGGNFVISGTNTISGGTFNLNSPATMSVSNLNLSVGTLGGSAPVAVNGPFNWTGGTINNTGGVTLNGISSLTASVGQMSLDSGGLLINAGPLTWSGSGLNFTFSSATLTNLATGTITITTDVSTQNGGGVNTIGNAGLIRKTGGTGTTAFGNVALVNTGDVQIQSGTLNLGNGGSATGTFEVPANSALQFSGGTYTLNAVSSITGAGNVLMSAGTVNENGNFVLGGTNTVSGTTFNVNIPATMAVSNLNFSAGTLSGNAPVPVNGPFNWAGGTINNTAGVKLNGTSSLTASSNQMNLSSGGLLINAGPLTWNGSNANFNFSTGTLTNLPSGTITIAADVSTQNGGGVNTIGNAGLIRKTGGVGTTTFTAVGLVNTGTLDAQSGTLSLAGGHNLTNGTLNFGISNLTTFGKINIPGAATLTGTVSANLINGYQPIGGNSFAVLTYGSRSNIFTNAVLPSADAWQTNYAATVFSLNVLNARPSLALITTQTVKELTTLTVTNIATDPDIPAQTLVFALPIHPSGMTIDTGTGVLTWTPDQTQSPSTNPVVVTVTDNGTPPLTATNSYNVIVQEVNVPPTLPAIPTQTINELNLLIVTNTATESNIHSTNAGYTLVSPPTGMSIDANGIITWTPDQTQSPSTNLITTIATNGNPFDLINPQLTSTNTFTVIVREVNVAPVLPAIPNQTINVLSQLIVTNAAIDSNIHAVLSYSLVSPPTGAIDATGVITWTPDTTQFPSTNIITTVATATDSFDAVNPILTATNSFTVFVTQPVLSIKLIQTNSAIISWSNPATGFVLQQNAALNTTNWVNNTNPTNVVSGQNQVTVTPPAGTNFYRLLHP